MNFIDKILNKITMYRLVVYVLAILATCGVVFAFFDRLSATPSQLVISLLLLITSAYVTDRGFGRLFHVPTNMESSLITALILFLIVNPAHTFVAGVALVLAGAISSASKFLVAWNGKHIFNPAAFAATVLGLTHLQAVTWWVGSSVFWPISLLLGLAIVRKIRKPWLFIVFVTVSIATQLAVFALHNQLTSVSLKHALIASPLIFLSTIMLTEPATMPPRRNWQMIYAALVAVLYATAWRLGPITIHPELALLLGNILAYTVSPKFRVRLTLKEIRKISDRVYDYVFQPDRNLAFLPGQYMEWTLAGIPYDSRGNRRTFSIASSPTETEVRLGMKFYEPASMFKSAIEQLSPGDVMFGSQVAGNFVLQGNEHKKLVFIAGGIGITPFRSMVQYIVDQKITADVTLLYVVSDPHEFAYVQELQNAAGFGVKIVPVVTAEGYSAPGVVSGRLDAGLISQNVPDFAERIFYISGPNVMVNATRGYLRSLGVARTRIKTDHFSGY